MGEKAFISYLVIMSTTCTMGLPVNQEEAKEVKTKDEAKKIKFEDLRDHDLQLSVNGGQSGGFLVILEANQAEQVTGDGTRPKRHQGDALLAEPTIIAEAPQEAAAVAPQEAAAPIDDAYAKRLAAAGRAIALANRFANAKRQPINRGPGSYGRKKRQALQRLGTTLTKPRSSSAFGSVYGRKKRQVSGDDNDIAAAEEEAILQEISEIKEAISKSSEIIPQIKSWGETGVLLPKSISA